MSDPLQISFPMQYNVHVSSLWLPTRQCLGHEGGSERVRVVRDDGASAAHLHRLNSTVNTTAAVKGRGVDRALWGGPSAQSDVAVLTPGGAPRVLDQPEVSL